MKFSHLNLNYFKFQQSLQIEKEYRQDIKDGFRTSSNEKKSDPTYESAATKLIAESLKKEKRLITTKTSSYVQSIKDEGSLNKDLHTKRKRSTLTNQTRKQFRDMFKDDDTLTTLLKGSPRLINNMKIQANTDPLLRAYLIEKDIQSPIQR